MDEVEGLCQSRHSGTEATLGGSMNRFANNFLLTMTEYRNVPVFGTTNNPWGLDSAFGRRFSTKIYVGLPNEEERVAMINARLSGFEHSLSARDIRDLSREWVGFTGDNVIKTINTAIKRLVFEFDRATHFQSVSSSS